MARGTIGKRGSTYYVRFYDAEGRQQWESVGSKKKDAEALLAERLRAVHRGEFQKLPDVTFAEFAAKFLEAHAARVRPGTLAGYRTHLEYRILPSLGSRKLKNLQPIDVEGFLADMRAEGVSPATSAKYLRTMKTVLKRAVRWGYLGRSPAEHIEYPRVTKPEMDFLTPGQLEKLIEATNAFEQRKHKNGSTSYHYLGHRCLVTVAAYTGMRKGELLGLQWGDVDFSASRIFVRRTLQEGHFYEPKTAYSRRSVTVPPAVIEALKTHKLEQAVALAENEHDLIFTTDDGKPMDTMNVTHRIFEPALRKAELPKVRFHDLRHSYASALISAGENIKWVQRQLGHSSIMVTMDTYGHLLPDIERNAGQRLEQALFTKKEVTPETVTV